MVMLKIFCFASFKVPSDSMAPTLLCGDYILVNKMIPGPRVFKDWNFFITHNWKMKRLKGLRSLKRNELVVFNFPILNNNWSRIEMDFNLHLVKRCVGLPGDIIEIVNGIYQVKGSMDTLGIYQNQMALSNMQRKDISKEIFNCLRYDSIHCWTIKYFGPLYIPKAHDRLKIDVNNIELYRKILYMKQVCASMFTEILSCWEENV
jgi:signal peptidase I